MASEYCLRCETVELTILPLSDDEITFYECPSCHRQFARASGKALCDRWGSPISLILYGIQFSPDPRAEYLRIAQSFLNERGRWKLEGMIEEVERELERPTQKVRDILPEMPHDENELRNFLRLVVDYWKEAL